VVNNSAVVILCGGVSRRLGVSKALLQVQGKPLFNLVAKNLSSLGLPVYLASKVALETQEVPLILDTLSEDTPLAGVLTALCSLHYSNYVFSAVDMPLVNGEVVMPLLECASEKECSVFYTVNGFLQPFPRSCGLMLWARFWNATTTGFTSSQRCSHVFLIFFCPLQRTSVPYSTSTRGRIGKRFKLWQVTTLLMHDQFA